MKGAILLFLVSVGSPDIFVGDRHPNDRFPSSPLYYFYSSLQRVVYLNLGTQGHDVIGLLTVCDVYVELTFLKLKC